MDLSLSWSNRHLILLAFFSFVACRFPTHDLNFQATFENTPTPFQIIVNADFIDQTRQRVALTRFTKDIDQPDLLDGPPVHNATRVKDHWVNHYDWAEVQKSLNKQYGPKIPEYSQTSWKAEALTAIAQIHPIHFRSEYL